jgi:hypothetical protein
MRDTYILAALAVLFAVLLAEGTWIVSAIGTGDVYQSSSARHSEATWKLLSRSQ